MTTHEATSATDVPTVRRPELKRGARRAGQPGFFQRELRMVAGDHIEVVAPEAEFAPADSML